MAFFDEAAKKLYEAMAPGTVEAFRSHFLDEQTPRNSRNLESEGMEGSWFPLPPTQFGQSVLVSSDEEKLRLKRKDLRSNPSVDLALRHLNRLHKQNEYKWSEEAVRQALLILTPDRMLEFVDPLVEDHTPLSEIYDQLYQCFGRSKPLKTLRYELSAICDAAAGEEDPLTVLGHISRLLQGSPGAMVEMNPLCLFEAQRYILRVAGEILAGAIEAKFQSSGNKSFTKYFWICSNHYSKSLRAIIRPSKKVLNHVAEEDLLDLSEGHSTIQQLNQIQAPPTTEVMSAILQGINNIKESMDRANQPLTQPLIPQPTGVMFVDPLSRPPMRCYECQGPHMKWQCPLLQRPPQASGNTRNWNSQKTGKDSTFLDQRCFIHTRMQHTNRSCFQQQSQPCPLTGHSGHILSQCRQQSREPPQGRDGGYQHNFTIPPGYPTQQMADPGFQQQLAAPVGYSAQQQQIQPQIPVHQSQGQPLQAQGQPLQAHHLEDGRVSISLENFKKWTQKE